MLLCLVQKENRGEERGSQSLRVFFSLFFFFRAGHPSLALERVHWIYSVYFGSRLSSRPGTFDQCHSIEERERGECLSCFGFASIDTFFCLLSPLSSLLFSSLLFVSPAALATRAGPIVWTLLYLTTPNVLRSSSSSLVSFSLFFLLLFLLRVLIALVCLLPVTNETERERERQRERQSVSDGLASVDLLELLVSTLSVCTTHANQAIHLNIKWWSNVKGITCITCPLLSPGSLFLLVTLCEKL